MVMDPDLIDLIPEYLERRRNEVISLRQMVKNFDFRGVRTIGHQIKGHALSYGFPELGTLGAALEECAAAEDGARCEEQISKIDSWLQTQPQ